MCIRHRILPRIPEVRSATPPHPGLRGACQWAILFFMLTLLGVILSMVALLFLPPRDP